MTNNVPTSEELFRADLSPLLQAYWIGEDPQDKATFDDIVALFRSAQIQLLERLMEQKQPMLPVYQSERIDAVPLSVIQGELDSLKGVK